LHAFISSLYDVFDIDWDGQEVKIIEKPYDDYFYSIYGEVFEQVKKAVRYQVTPPSEPLLISFADTNMSASSEAS
jgi:hypothetical protein